VAQPRRTALHLGLLLLSLAVAAWIWFGRAGKVPANSVAPGAVDRAAVPALPPSRDLVPISAPAPPPVSSPGAVAPADPPRIASSVVAGSPVTRTVPKPVAPAMTTLPAPAPPPLSEQLAARADVENVGLMFRDFRTRLGENPVGSNAEIMRAIMGGNAVSARLGPPVGQTLNAQGELVDRWGSPYFFHQLSRSEMEIRSAGPDRILWTGDDVVGK
jgi:hypothetical protein